MENRYWIAVNGPSCAISAMPMRDPMTVPCAEQMWGFPTFEEAQAAQHVVLNAPTAEVMRWLNSLQPDIMAGRIVYKRPAHPDPATRAQTIWLESHDEEELAQTVPD